ncbi:MAG: HAD family hydrolase [Lachnospiraceae bacterium]|nr:HAD family hydrolase [Lachnospiraceae bacterium]
MFRAILLDLDGTLADSLESLAISCNEALKECGLSPHPKEAYKKFAGDGPPTLVERAITASGDIEKKYYEKVLHGYQEKLKDYKNYKIDTFHGMHEALQKIKDAGGKLIVITNKPQERAEEVVAELFGEGYFDLVVGYSEKFPRKPSPDSTKYAMEYFGLQPNACMYVGDTDVDMKTGKGAGAYTVGVLWGFREKEELEVNGADIIIKNPLELVDIYFDK